MIRVPRCLPFVGLSLLVVSATLIAERKLAPYHFLTVTPGHVYRSGLMSPEDLEEVIERYGIRTVVNLQSVSDNRSDWHADEAEVCRRLGTELLDLPLEWEEPPSPAQQQIWRDLLADRRRGPVLVHCQHGVVRTGMLIAVYELDRGQPREEVLAELPSFGHRLTRERHEKMWDFLRSYTPPLVALK